MQRYLALPTVSLRVKLILSYLLVALGAILILAFALVFAVQNYFISTQIASLRETAEYQAQQIAYRYHYRSLIQSAGNGVSIQESNDPVILVIVNAAGQQAWCSEPGFITNGNCNDPTLRAALAQSIKGKEVNGNIRVSTQNGSFKSLYVSVPIQNNGHIIGALFLSAPQQYPNGFLSQINQAVLIAGTIVALIVILFSFLLARRFTRPLKSLTVAAEQMKQGKYTQRVQAPRTQDELGLLALTFNDMADTIEADVTELRRQDQIRRDLIANIAHDLATPLTAIQGFSEALADDMIPTREARQETAQRIGREVQRLRRLVSDIQQMSSLESGHTRLDLAPLDLHSLAEETFAVIETECEEAGISLRNELDPATSMVLADGDRITQVLLNLLDNARRHTPAGGTIRIAAVPEGKMLLVSVSDTGTGIAPADLPHIFERFYRADRSRTGATGGSGLGLAIVKAVITAHGGVIRAESTPGQGTRITFSLPRAAQLPGRPQGSPIPYGSTHAGKN